MCWFKLPKVEGLAGKLRATDMQRTAAQEAQKPDAPVFGGTRSWEVASKKRGVSALRIDTDRTTPTEKFVGALNKDKATGVNRNYNSGLF